MCVQMSVSNVLTVSCPWATVPNLRVSPSPLLPLILKSIVEQNSQLFLHNTSPTQTKSLLNKRGKHKWKEYQKTQNRMVFYRIKVLFLILNHTHNNISFWCKSSKNILKPFGFPCVLHLQQRQCLLTHQWWQITLWTVPLWEFKHSQKLTKWCISLYSIIPYDQMIRLRGHLTIQLTQTRVSIQLIHSNLKQLQPFSTLSSLVAFWMSVGGSVEQLEYFSDC